MSTIAAKSRHGRSDASDNLLLPAADVWRDDSTRMAGRLAAAGGSVELHVVADMWHCWPVWGEFPEADNALDTIAGFMHRSAPTA
jgi:acetyl esterase/lipase